MKFLKEWFLKNSDWIVLISGLSTVVVNILEYLLLNPENYSISDAYTQIPVGIFMFTLLFYIIRIFKGANRRIDLNE